MNNKKKYDHTKIHWKKLIILMLACFVIHFNYGINDRFFKGCCCFEINVSIKMTVFLLYFWWHLVHACVSLNSFTGLCQKRNNKNKKPFIFFEMMIHTLVHKYNGEFFCWENHIRSWGNFIDSYWIEFIFWKLKHYVELLRPPAMPTEKVFHSDRD